MARSGPWPSFSAAAAAVIGRLIPAQREREVPSIRAEFAALRQGRLWLALSASTLIMGGVLATYSYITPLLTERAGIPEGAVPLVLIAFGLGALGGVTIGGRLGDRRPMGTTIIASAATALVLLLLIPLSSSSTATVVLVFLMGLTGFAVNPVISALTMRSAGAAPTLAAALSTSAFNVGIAVGSWVAGMALASPLGPAGPRDGRHRHLRAHPRAADRPRGTAHAPVGDIPRGGAQDGGQRHRHGEERLSQRGVTRRPTTSVTSIDINMLLSAGN